MQPQALKALHGAACGPACPCYVHRVLGAVQVAHTAVRATGLHFQNCTPSGPARPLQTAQRAPRDRPEMFTHKDRGAAGREVGSMLGPTAAGRPSRRGQACPSGRRSPSRRSVGDLGDLAGPLKCPEGAAAAGGAWQRRDPSGAARGGAGGPRSLLSTAPAVACAAHRRAAAPSDSCRRPPPAACLLCSLELAARARVACVVCQASRPPAHFYGAR